MSAIRQETRTSTARDGLLMNAVSLVGTSAVTSGLGFVFWWVAARRLPPELVGAGSAAVSAMLLLGTLAMLGLGTLLIGELPRRRAGAPGLLSAALVVCGAVAVLACGAFALLLPLLPGAPGSAFAWVGQGPALFGLFAAGVVLTAVTLVFDQAVIGLLRGDLQLWRNGLASVFKILAVGLAGWLAAGGGSQVVYTAWLVGNVASVAGVLLLARRRGVPLLARPDWAALRELRGGAGRHHALNLAMQAPSLALPVLVAATLGPGANAGFYVAWMVAGFVGMVPYALATVLPAVEGGDPAALRGRLRASLRWALLACSLGAAALIVLAPTLLGSFGDSYRQATDSLRVLALTSLPVIVKAHYIALGRLRGDLGRVAAVVLVGGLLELGAAWGGARVGGLMGLSFGLLLAYGAQALSMGPAVLRGAGFLAGGAGAAPRRREAAVARDTGRFEQLDALRGLAALTVVFGHFLNVIPVLGQAGDGPFRQAALYVRWYKYTPAFTLTAAHEAVILFFLLSGFVLALPFVRGDRVPYRSFLVKRVCRIYLPYLLATLLGVFGMAAFSTGGLPVLSAWVNSVWTGRVTAPAVAQHVLLLGSFDNAQFNASIWSLVHEMRVSLLFPVIVAAVLRVSARTSLLGALGLSVVGMTLDHRLGGHPDYFLTLHYLGIFVVGILIARHRDTLRAVYFRLTRPQRGAVIGLGALLYVYGRALALALPDWQVQDWPILLGAAVIVVWALFSERVAGLLRVPALRALGQISYSLYLMHSVVLFTCLYLLSGRWPLAAVLALALAVTFAVSVLFHLAVERPALRWGQRLARRLR